MLLKFAGAALGDMLAWFPCAEAFREKHGCELYVLTDKRYCEILQAGYPDIHFLTPEDLTWGCSPPGTTGTCSRWTGG